MATLDMSIPYYPVLMTWEKQDIPALTLAKGYRFVPYDDSYREAWIDLHVRLKQLPNKEEGSAYFAKTFETQREALDKQMILVCDAQGQLAGTSSIWEGFHFGERRYRVHWVGVDPAHQRRGLAKALMVKTLHLYEDMHIETPLYLTTQTNSYIAIGMYEQLGFKRYLGDMPPQFQGQVDTFLSDNTRAWQIIDDMLHRQ